MAKRNLNQAERYVVRRWAASYELELSLASAREKYQEMCERIIEDVIETHPGFYAPRVRVIQISGNQPGTICLSKKTWPKNGKSACGFWMENIRLEHVADEDTPAPLLSVWIDPSEFKSDDLLEQATQRIAAEAAIKLPKVLLDKATKIVPDDGYAVAYEFVSKAEFLDILADDDPERFPELMTENLEILLALTSAIDEVFSSKS